MPPNLQDTVSIIVPRLRPPTHGLGAVDPALDSAAFLPLSLGPLQHGALVGPHPHGTFVGLLHTGFELYADFVGLPQGGTGQRAVFRADLRRASASVGPSSYEFAATAAGTAMAARGAADGTFAPLAEPFDGLSSVAEAFSDQTWRARMQLGLEWMGGFARTIGVMFSLEHDDGIVLAQWPHAAAANAPPSWGPVTLAPQYRQGIAAGSVFLDGRDGHLVVPFDSALNPSAITIEAWARVVDGCGTVVGNGRDHSYWLAICQVLHFGDGRHDAVLSGRRVLDDGWHHLAATMDEVGVRTLFVDGDLDVRSDASDETGSGVVPRLGTSDRALRIGSDRDTRGRLDHLHGYLRDLRIWDRARSLDEIRATAFQGPSGAEPDLVGWWPFTDGLHDRVGGRDAGLIGNASLARESSLVVAFPQPEVPPIAGESGPDLTPAWDADIPMSATPIPIDGTGWAGKYYAATRIPLEPDRATSRLTMMLGPDALYLVTNPIFGEPGSATAVTVWINRDGGGGATPGTTDLRVRLTPNNQPDVHIGDGEGFGVAGPAGIEQLTIGDTRYDLQEDILPIEVSWWSSEVRIPLEMLQPFRPGQPLRFAVLYEAVLPPNAVPGQPDGGASTRWWPAQFDPQRPDSWGTANTASDPAQGGERPSAPKPVIPPGGAIIGPAPLDEPVPNPQLPGDGE